MMTNKRIHQIFGIVLSLALAVAGICLIAACVGIYRSGDRPFSAEAVATAFSQICIPVYICLALVIVGIVLNCALPVQKEKQPVQKQYGPMLQKLSEKLDLEICGPSVRKAICAERNSRRLHCWICIALLGIGSVLFFLFGADPKQFDDIQINSSMIRAMQWFFPCLAVPFGYAVFCSYQHSRSQQREIELVKQALAAGCKKSQSPAPVSGAKSWAVVLRYALLGIGIVIMVYGFLSGGTVDVLTKAVNICTECVGLG